MEGRRIYGLGLFLTGCFCIVGGLIMASQTSTVADPKIINLGNVFALAGLIILLWHKIANAWKWFKLKIGLKLDQSSKMTDFIVRILVRWQTKKEEIKKAMIAKDNKKVHTKVKEINDGSTNKEGLVLKKPSQNKNKSKNQRKNQTMKKHKSKNK